MIHLEREPRTIRRAAGPSPVARQRVVKLGGSLLDLPDLFPRLRRWLVQQPHAQNLLVVGGGERVERVRRQGARWQDAEAHWHCIDLMDENAQRVADCWSAGALVGRWSELRPACRSGDTWHEVRVLRVRPLLCDPHRPSLPIGWHVTSDSIAAHIAAVLDADELVLLKSRRPSGTAEWSAGDWDQWASQGYVDEYFPVAARALRSVRAVSLRS